MDYTQLFRQLREAHDLTLEQLAAMARVHRNTVVNIECGRPVKFSTIATLMRTLGYADNSAEMKSIALLWLESVSGLPLSRPTTETSAKKAIATFRSPLRQATQELDEAVVDANLTADQIRLLTFAARRPEVLTILENVRDLLGGGAERPAAPVLQAAEDQSGYRTKA